MITPEHIIVSGRLGDRLGMVKMVTCEAPVGDATPPVGRTGQVAADDAARNSSAPCDGLAREMAIRQQTGGTVQVACLGSKANRFTVNEHRYRERLRALESL